MVKGYEAELSKELDVEIATLRPPLDTRTGMRPHAGGGDRQPDRRRHARGDRRRQSPSPMAAASAPTSSIRPAQADPPRRAERAALRQRDRA